MYIVVSAAVTVSATVSVSAVVTVVVEDPYGRRWTGVNRLLLVGLNIVLVTVHYSI